MLEKNDPNEKFTLEIMEEIIECDRKILDLNLGGKAGRACMDKIIGKLKKADEVNKQIKKAQILMNVKPDIAVIFKIGGKLYLKFLECKFESSEDKYDGFTTQSEAQSMVGDFLCNYLEIKYEDQIVTKCETKLVYFRRNSEDGESDKIRINELIKLNNEIFS